MPTDFAKPPPHGVCTVRDQTKTRVCRAGKRRRPLNARVTPRSWSVILRIRFRFLFLRLPGSPGAAGECGMQPGFPATGIHASVRSVCVGLPERISAFQNTAVWRPLAPNVCHTHTYTRNVQQTLSRISPSAGRVRPKSAMRIADAF